MSNYVEQNLMPNEKVIAVGKIHWWVYVPGAVLTVLGLIVAGSSSGSGFGVLMFVVGIFLFVKAWIASTSTELAITNKRVVAKFGFIRRSTIELLHNKVESFHVDQGIFGRILDFGTVIVNGTGGAKTPIPGISSPLVFRRQALSVIEGGQNQN